MLAKLSCVVIERKQTLVLKISNETYCIFIGILLLLLFLLLLITTSDVVLVRRNLVLKLLETNLIIQMIS